MKGDRTYSVGDARGETPLQQSQVSEGAEKEVDLLNGTNPVTSDPVTVTAGVTAPIDVISHPEKGPLEVSDRSLESASLIPDHRL